MRHDIDFTDFYYEENGERKFDYARLDEEMADGCLTFRDLYNLAYLGDADEAKVAIGWLAYQGIETLDDVKDWIDRNLFEDEANIARPAIVGLLALRDEKRPVEWSCWTRYNVPMY